MSRDLNSSRWIGRRVRVTVDRPMSSTHPDDPSLVYPLNYGHVPGTAAGDGEPIDVYVIDSREPLSGCEAEVIAVIRRRDDDEDKLVARIGDGTWSASAIEDLTRFQERWFDSVVDMGDPPAAAT